MEIEKQLTDTIDQLQKLKYQYAFLSDGVTHGSMNVNVDANMINNSKQLNFEVPIYTFGNQVLYIIKQDIIIGYVKGNMITEDLHEYMDESDIYIDSVKINIQNQKKGLCKMMVKLFILCVNNSKNNYLSYILANTGGTVSCRCYINAFNECGYLSFLYDEITTEKTLITNDMCSDNTVFLKFSYTRGGFKSSKRNKKSRRNKKSSKINKKSKQNKKSTRKG
jgi:hypothetical protein